MVSFEWGGELHRAKEGKNWAYILREEKNFSMLGYKLIQSQGQEGLLHCAKVRYNGRLKLIYLTGDCRSLPFMLTSLQESGIWTLFYKLITAVLHIRENGFLSCSNIDILPECIYFDPKTLDPYLIYLPLATDGSEDGLPEFEEAFRRSMVQALKASDHTMLHGEGNSLPELFADTTGGLDGLRKRLLNNKENASACLVLQCRNSRIPISFEVDKDNYMIGRKRDNDGVLDCSKRVSRVHCRIVREDNLYYIADEESSCGTFVNEAACRPGERKELHEGDVVRLADMEFGVRMQTR